MSRREALVRLVMQTLAGIGTVNFESKPDIEIVCITCAPLQYR